MKVLILGGSGLIGQALIHSLAADSHEIWVLTRSPKKSRFSGDVHVVRWDGRTTDGWGHLAGEVDAVVNLVGENLATWPWTEKQKQRFWDSRVNAGRAVVAAVKSASRYPKVLIQSSGINYYGLRGTPADESTPPGEDFLAQLAVAWENSTMEVEDLGVRRVVIRTAVVFATNALLYNLMALPVRLFVGGRLGSGEQSVPWSHLEDHVAAVRFLLENDSAQGPFNLTAPGQLSNADFYRTMARVMKRPYWFPVPAFLMRLVLGEMSVLVLEGRFSKPAKLLGMGFRFKYPELDDALRDLLAR
jgi:uncharacterized protein (TIGR01777 family)